MSSIRVALPSRYRWPEGLLWLDCTAGGAVGLLVLLLHDLLTAWYGLPASVVTTIGVANLAYATFSFSLARRAQRPLPLLLVLIAANAVWAGVCAAAAVYFASSASWLGLGHLVAEGLVVGGLAMLEWQAREQLTKGHRGGRQ